MSKDVDMDDDETSAALRNQGFERQARFADKGRATARAELKHMTKSRELRHRSAHT